LIWSFWLALIGAFGLLAAVSALIGVVVIVDY
jgi:hypothetical protein